MSIEDTGYEIFVQDIHQVLLNAQGLHTIKVQHDIQLVGSSGQSHQVDVYWEYSYAGIVHKVALECKNYSNRISMGRIRDFFGVLDDVVGLQGIMVTTLGYQSGVIKFAKFKGIGLRIVRPAKDDDYTGRIRTLKMEVHMLSIHLTEFNVLVDEKWIEENMTIEEQELTSQPYRIDSKSEVILNNIQEKTREPLHRVANQILNEAPRDDLEIGDVTHEYQVDYTDAYLEYPDRPTVKLCTLKIKYVLSEFRESFLVGGNKLAKAVVKDAITNNLIFIDSDDSLSGDRTAFGLEDQRQS